MLKNKDYSKSLKREDRNKKQDKQNIYQIPCA